jgi:hypothetical protein
LYDLLVSFLLEALKEQLRSYIHRFSELAGQSWHTCILNEDKLIAWFNQSGSPNNDEEFELNNYSGAW